MNTVLNRANLSVSEDILRANEGFSEKAEQNLNYKLCSQIEKNCPHPKHKRFCYVSFSVQQFFSFTSEPFSLFWCVNHFYVQNLGFNKLTKLHLAQKL